jgi:DNA-binding protein Fis
VRWLGQEAMERKLPKRRRGRNYNQSIKKILEQENKISTNLKLLINNLSLEDLIALKLELSAAALNGKLHGFPIWNMTSYIVRESMLKFALSTSSSHKQAALILGITVNELRRQIKVYNINEVLDRE